MSKQTLIDEIEQLVKEYQENHDRDQDLQQRLFDMVCDKEPALVARGLILLGVFVENGIIGPTESEDVEFDGVALAECSVKTLTEMVSAAKDMVAKETTCS